MMIPRQREYDANERLWIVYLTHEGTIISERLFVDTKIIMAPLGRLDECAAHRTERSIVCVNVVICAASGINTAKKDLQAEADCAKADGFFASPNCPTMDELFEGLVEVREQLQKIVDVLPGSGSDVQVAPSAAAVANPVAAVACSLEAMVGRALDSVGTLDFETLEELNNLPPDEFARRVGIFDVGKPPGDDPIKAAMKGPLLEIQAARLDAEARKTLVAVAPHVIAKRVGATPYQIMHPERSEDEDSGSESVAQDGA